MSDIDDKKGKRQRPRNKECAIYARRGRHGGHFQESVRGRETLGTLTVAVRQIGGPVRLFMTGRHGRRRVAGHGRRKGEALPAEKNHKQAENQFFHGGDYTAAY